MLKRDCIISGHRNTPEQTCCGKNCKSPLNGKFQIIFFKFGDAPFHYHGEYVSNLIASPHPSAPTPLKTPLNYIPFYDLHKKSEHYDSFMRCQEENSCPSYINISMGLPEFSEQGLNVINLINQTNTVVVTSAGNLGKLMTLIERKYVEQINMIVVGNCGTDGNPYHNSSYAPEITVCAPSGDTLISYDFAGNLIRFGGTSGAAPQVTGALVAFTAITGYSLNPREAIELLQKTATPHPHLPTQSNMGAGMLNTWKIGEVAFKLRKRCQENKTCYATSLQSEDTFKFSVDKQSLMELKDFRKAALLNPFDGELWSLIASINRNKCLGEQAQYYQSLANRAEKTNRELLYELGENEQYSMLKYLSFSHREIKEDLTELYLFLLEKKDIDGEALMELSKALIINADFNFAQQTAIWEMLINHPNFDRTLLAEVGVWVADKARYIPSHEKLLQTIINHSKIDGAGLGEIGKRIAYRARYIKAHERFLKEIVNHPNINGAGLGEVGKWVAYIAGYMPTYEIFYKQSSIIQKLMG